MMRWRWTWAALPGALAVAVGAFAASCGGSTERADPDGGVGEPSPEGAEANALSLIAQGREAFRHDTMGNEAFWSGQLQLQDAIRGEANGGVGPGLSPAAALELGIRVDVDALPEEVQIALGNGDVDLESPSTTLDLLRLEAVVGVTGFFDGDELTGVGINCALCHSDVDDSFAPSIGRRLDGYANRDVNPGAIIALAPSLEPFINLLGVDDATVRSVLNSWGPGAFDGHLVFDGQPMGPGGEPAAVLNPPLHGRAGVNLATYNGWGSQAYWIGLVPNIELFGEGTFDDARLADADEFPVAAAAGLDRTDAENDRITPLIPALHVYLVSLPAPVPEPGSFDEAAAERGEALFNGAAQCATCHVPPLYSEPGWNLHPASDIGIDSFHADRGPEDAYRTTPLLGLAARQTGGFYHDGRFATVDDVIDHYNGVFDLGLGEDEQSDLAQFLLSL
ncbi:MAG: hypothetical protein ACFCGT_18580 [Sandaracinaceae bacterium]